ncbi:protein argonaute-2-like isoform X1, partial [Dinothrombium tinctorium]
MGKGKKRGKQKATGKQETTVTTETTETVETPQPSTSRQSDEHVQAVAESVAALAEMGKGKKRGKQKAAGKQETTVTTETTETIETPQPSTSRQSDEHVQAVAESVAALQLEAGPSTSGGVKSKDAREKLEKEIVEAIKPQQRYEFVKRPGYGRIGERVGLTVNYFLMKVDKLSFYHYDVVIEVLSGDQASAAGDEKLKKIKGRETNHQVIRQMIESNQSRNQLFYGFYPVFDGEKNMYTAKDLNIPETGIRLKVALKDGGRERNFYVTLKLVRYISYDRRTPLSEDLCLQISQVIETLLVYAAKFSMNPKVSIRSSIFNPDSEKKELGENKFLNFGYYSNVKYTKSGWVCNVDRAAAVFNDGGPLLNVFEKLGVRISPPYFINDNDRNKLKKKLNRLKIFVTHLAYRRKYTFEGLTERTVSTTIINIDGKDMSVRDYFEQKYGAVLKKQLGKSKLEPNLPCVIVGRDKYLPLEVCILLPNQPAQGKLSEEILSQMTRQSQIRPRERFQVIEESRNSMCSDANNYIQQFGVSIDQRPMHVEGRVLPLPRLQNKDVRDSPSPFQPQSFGSWRMTRPDKHFFLAVPLRTWLLFNFDTGLKPNEISSFVGKLIEVASRYGVIISNPIERATLSYSQFKGQIGSRLFDRALKNMKNLQLLMFIIPKEDGLYEEIKQAGDVMYGLPSQCIASKHFRPQRKGGRQFPPMVLNDDYIGNVLQKVNFRLGGINTILDYRSKPKYLKERTM